MIVILRDQVPSVAPARGAMAARASALASAQTINVTITPDPAQVGNTLSGFLYIDTFNPAVTTGDEVVRIPYRYTVVP